MSVEEVKRLDADVKSNDSLAAEFKACKDMDGFVSLATSKGYNISADDIKTASTKNLSDEELDNVAGGQFIVAGIASAGGIVIMNP